jgi:23S rRNA (cytidine1920-2'-O)/16S rRNA (cytidine1409-2'-O)-methyltransferase
MNKKIRLDQRVFDLGFEESREKAKAAIMAGIIYVDGKRIDKPGFSVSSDSLIEIRGKSCPYVSRGGYKLEKALRSFNLNVEGKTYIDCGASTGGFTDVLLQNGAKKVYAVDVGYGQLAWKIRTDPRVVNMERTNIRYITNKEIPEMLDGAVMDLAFISLVLAIPPVLKLLKNSANIVCLIKPQFEAGKNDVGKKGVVRDPETHLKVINKILAFAQECDLSVMGLDYSPIQGPEGNIEYLCWLKKGNWEPASPINPALVVEKSHKNFS